VEASERLRPVLKGDVKGAPEKERAWFRGRDSTVSEVSPGWQAGESGGYPEPLQIMESGTELVLRAWVSCVRRRRLVEIWRGGETSA